MLRTFSVQLSFQLKVTACMKLKMNQFLNYLLNILSSDCFVQMIGKHLFKKNISFYYYCCNRNNWMKQHRDVAQRNNYASLFMRNAG